MTKIKNSPRQTPARKRLPQTPQLPASQPQLPILYRSNQYIIINKPPGLPVHATRRAQHSVEDYFPDFSRRKDGPWLAHRLDQDTSGCLLIALRKHALIAAQTAFAAQNVKKIYWAVVEGRPSQMSGLIEASLKRCMKEQEWKMVVDARGLPSATKWRILETRNNRSLLELELLTGRTHQARVHCAAIGHPIIGDATYGHALKDARHLLHCRHLRLTHAGIDISATAPPPEDMSGWLPEQMRVP